MKVSIYMAMSLDGYIATKDHGLKWLETVNVEGEDYGYAAFMSTVDCILMGRNTYNTVSGFGFWPYEGKKVLVLTHKDLSPIQDEVAVSGSLKPILNKLEKEGIQHVYLDGGMTARLGLIEGVVSDITLSVIPILLGSGISLFEGLNKEIRLSQANTQSFPSGLIQLKYRTDRESP